MSKKTYVIDSNVLIHDPRCIFKFDEHDIKIPIVVLEELDKLKKDSREVGRSARVVTRYIKELIDSNISSNNIMPINDKGGTIEIVLNCPWTLIGLDETKPDHQILNTAKYLNAILVTNDSNLYAKAKPFNVPVQEYKNDRVSDDDTYTGMETIIVDTSYIDSIYAKGYIELNDELRSLFVDLYPNLNVIMKDSNKHSALCRYDAQHEILKVLPQDQKIMGLIPRNIEQRFAIDMLLDPNIKLVTLEGLAGSGKAQPLDADVLTPSGYVKMGDLKLNDYVICPNGNISKIIGLFPQGKKDIYKIIFSDGSSTECCDEHLWNVKTPYDRSNQKKPKETKSFRTLSLKDIRNSVLIKDDREYSRYIYSIPQVGQSIDFKLDNNIGLEIDPYLLGLLLGDGGFTASINFTTADDFLYEECNKYLAEINCKLSKKNKKYGYNVVTDDTINMHEIGRHIKLIDKNNIEYFYDSLGAAKRNGHEMGRIYRFANTGKCDSFGNLWSLIDRDNLSKSPIKNFLLKNNLYGKKSEEKHIPKQYLYTTAENRIKLLQGLMDTDGYVDATGKSLEFYSSSYDLANGVKFLVESLGGIVTWTVKKTSYRDKDGDIVECLPCNRLNLRIPPNIIPFKLPRKKNRYKPKSKYLPTRFIKSIEYVGQKEAQCILIDDPEHLYITNNFIVTHNTLCSCSAGLYLVTEKQEYKKLLIFRPFVPMGNDLGYVPGSLDDKILPWMQPIVDNVDYILSASDKGESKKSKGKSSQFASSVSGADTLVNYGLLEYGALNFIRGRSIPDQFIIVDDAANLSLHEMKTLITRAGENTKIVLTFDPNQVDSPYLDSTNNGATIVANKFKYEKIHGHIKFTKSERSDLASVATRIL
ncbi:MAG: PhoH family protein [Tenuifilaceae bacterium]|nr:PhoH family protein [Tenuifilaceae bacterium]